LLTLLLCLPTHSGMQGSIFGVWQACKDERRIAVVIIFFLKQNFFNGVLLPF